MKEHIKAPEKIQLSDEEIATLSDTEFKKLIIRMLTEMVEYSQTIEGKVKAMQSEIKQTKSEGKEPGLKSRVWSRRKKDTFNQKRMKKQKFKKIRRGLGIFRTTINVPTSES